MKVRPVGDCVWAGPLRFAERGLLLFFLPAILMLEEVRKWVVRVTPTIERRRMA